MLCWLKRRRKKQYWLFTQFLSGIYSGNSFSGVFFCGEVIVNINKNELGLLSLCPTLFLYALNLGLLELSGQSRIMNMRYKPNLWWKCRHVAMFSHCFHAKVEMCEFVSTGNIATFRRTQSGCIASLEGSYSTSFSEIS